MIRLQRRNLILPGLLAMLLAGGACNNGKDNGAVKKGNVQINNATPRGRSRQAPDGGNRPIRSIMVKFDKGPQALNRVLGEELDLEPPPWDTIQPHTREFAELATSLSKFNPPKGSQESWAKLTGSFADSVATLDRAAQAKDKQGAFQAHKLLGASCNACHREHRQMGRAGMGSPGGFGRPGNGSRGGPPPGGP